MHQLGYNALRNTVADKLFDISGYKAFEKQLQKAV